MNTANKLTLCRVVMIPIFIVLLYLEFAGHLWVASISASPSTCISPSRSLFWPA